MIRECPRLKNKESLDCEGDWLGADGLCDCMFPESYDCLKNTKIEKQGGDSNGQNGTKVVPKN
jgi:hypothetical protein